MMDKLDEKICNFIDRFDNFTKNPEEFLEVQDNVENVKEFVKSLYDFTKTIEHNKSNETALPELIIDNFDEEQIWQEIELQNNDNINKFTSEVSWLSGKKDKLFFPVRLKKEIDAGECKSSVIKKKIMKMETHNDVDGEIDEDDDDDDDDENNDLDKNLLTDDESAEDVLLNRHKKENKIKQKPSIVDDKFFKLSEMEEFLLAEEKREGKNIDESDFGIDMFEDIPSSDNEEEEEEQVRYKYKDFFADPSAEQKHLLESDVMDVNDDKKDLTDSDNMNDNVSDGDVDAKNNSDDDFHLHIEDDSETNGNMESNKQVRFNLSDDDDDGEEEDDFNNRNEMDSNESNVENAKSRKGTLNELKSTFEKRKERLSKHIEKLEQKALSEKPWQMKGEISATARPENSLLEEVLEFDVTSRPAPVMTEETTERLEDIIIHRIKDKAWDDVERKLKPVETVNEFKKRLVLDQEKSKLSLAQIYEQEYIKQRDAATAVGLKTDDKEPEELPEHKEIKNMMISLFSKLNSLANFHYTPKPAAPDIKIVSNIPAVNMEEVAPVTTSDATLLAPEEVVGKKKKELIGKEERTKTDKKRERRKKKHWQKLKRKEQEARQFLNDQKSKKYTVEKATKDLKKLSNNRAVQIDTSSNKKAIKTSTAFFSRLQDEVKSKISGQLKDKKKDKPINNAKKLKL
ncbi:U3 small nucleolar ribonucleoprotein MPP10 [Lycorma delicatula]|uniref:U3 small nucleolar ribonucleoprotein MPP10 n=1 Tax=Lycorma delicatula TaxID=130591 RepID=UPI003F518F25